MALVPARPPYRFTVEEYLAFERTAEERHEYLDGLIYATAGESPHHGRLCMNLSVSLGSQLRGSSCEAFSKDTKVRCGPYRAHTREGLYAYPDLVIVCGAMQFHDQVQDVLLNPTIIIEVLSPSTAACTSCTCLLPRLELPRDLAQNDHPVAVQGLILERQRLG